MHWLCCAASVRPRSMSDAPYNEGREGVSKLKLCGLKARAFKIGIKSATDFVAF